jgi:hypothetical protein
MKGNCYICGKEFIKQPYTVKQITCGSWKCQMDHQRKRTAKNNAIKKRVGKYLAQFRK